MVEASRLAPRTEVAWVETTTAPLTMTSACTVLSSQTTNSSKGSGRQPARSTMVRV